MDEIKGILHSVVTDLMKKQKGVDFQKALDAWKKIVGSKACAHTQIVYLTKDKMRVNVNSSSWLYELNLKKERIARDLEKALKISDIRFRLGEVKEERKGVYGRR